MNGTRQAWNGWESNLILNNKKMKTNNYNNKNNNNDNDQNKL